MGLTPRSTQGTLMLTERVAIAAKHEIKIAQHKIDEISLIPPYLAGAVLARTAQIADRQAAIAPSMSPPNIVKALNNGQ
jgi:hypothetical protein